MMNTEAGTNILSEAFVNTPFFEDGVLSLMAVSVFTNTAAGVTNVYSRKNGADGNMTVSIPAAGTGRFYDLTNSDTIANGDNACWRCDRGGAVQFGYVGAYYETNSGVIVNKIGVMGTSNVATGTGHVAMIGAISDAITDGSAAQCPTISVGCEAKNLWAYSSSNTRSSTSTISDRVNAGAGSLSVNFTPATAGLQTASGTTTIAAGDEYNYQRVTSAGSGALTLTMIGVDLHYPANEFQLFSANMGGVGFNATTARYGIPSGAFSAAGNLNPSSILLYGSGKVKDLNLYIPTNVGTVAQIWDMIINGAVSSMTTTSGISATGLFTDLTNEPTFADGQNITLRYLKSSGSGATTLRWFTVTIEFDVVDNFIPLVMFS
jgi:hypothetical protein